MISALLYLQYHAFRNRLRTRLARLKQPKYLAGGIVGGAYFYYYFIRHLFPGPRGRSPAFEWTTENSLLVESVAALGLLLVAFVGWLIPNKRTALTFTEAEVAFLFPAPISRRGLIHYKLLRSQMAILFSTLVLVLVSNRLGGNALIHAAGLWVLLSTLNLHALASSLTRTRLLDSGISNWQRRAAVLLLAAMATSGVAWWAYHSIPGFNLGELKNPETVKDYANQLFLSGPLPYLLVPFRLVVRPYLTADGVSFLIALGPALLVLLAHYWWVVRSNVAFEEASVEASRKLAEKIAAVRAGNWNGTPRIYRARRAWFRLRPVGPPLVALAWKNFISAVQISRRGLGSLVVMVAILMIMASRMQGKEVQAIFAMILSMLLVWSFLLGPQIFRQDLRQDLPMADLLKSYPLPGWQVVLGEILTPMLILSTAQLTLLTIGLCVAGGLLEQLALNWATLLGLSFGVIALVPAINFVMMQIPNGASLLFPAWINLGKESAHGVEAMGQRLIMALGQALAFLVLLLPAALAFALVFFPLQWLVNPAVAIPVASLVAAAVLGFEGALGIYWLGKVFERFDLSVENA